MITPQDLAAAQKLLSEGRLDAAKLGRLLAEAAQGESFSVLLAREGLAPPSGAPETGIAAGPRVPPPDAGRVATRVPSASAPPGLARRIGRYEIQEEVARGGMGVVYRAIDPALGRTIALKVLLAGSIAGPEQIARFQREARAAAGLAHPNIVQVYEVGHDADMHFIAMEFVDGMAVDRLMRLEKPIPIRKALRIARDTARALDHAHRNGIVHRDIKPGNILLAGSDLRGGDDTGSYRVLLGDFGLARDTNATSGLTVSGNLLGTPAYMSPEQAWGRASTLGPLSDVFSLGAVLYELIAGRVPFPGSSIGDVLNAIQSADPRPLGRMRPGLHRDVAVIVHHALAKDPAGRYQSAGEFADDIDRFLRGEPTVAQPPTRRERAARWARRHVAALVAATVVFIAGSAGTALWVHGAIRGRQEARDRVEAEARARRTRVEGLLAEAISAGETGNWEEALVKASTARHASPGDPAVEAAARDLRLRRVMARHARLTAGPEPDWGRARASLEAASEFRDHPEVRGALRQVEGTCTWQVETIEPGVDVDLGECEAEVPWDEETFPSLAEARERGLCTPVGRAPFAPRDIAFGRHLVVFSRDGAVLRVLTLVLSRGSHGSLEHRVIRVGNSADSQFRTLDEAFAAARTGGTIEVEPGDYEAPALAMPPGVLLHATGPVVRLHRPDAGISFSPGAGSTIRDLEIPFPRTGAIGGEGCVRPTLIRLRLGTTEGQAVGFDGAMDVCLREVTAESRAGHALNLNSTGSLVIGSSFLDGRWAVVFTSGTSHRFIRCRFMRGERCGLAAFGEGLEVRECAFQDHPEWSVLPSGGGEVVIQDCLFLRGSLSAVTANSGVIVGLGGEGEISHNTLVGGAPYGICAGSGGLRVTSNILVGLTTYKGPLGDIPAAAFFLFTAPPHPSIDHNLVWDTEYLVSTRRKARFRTPQELDAAPADKFPRGWRPMAAGVFADPRFVDPANSNFRLVAGSPAIGASPDGTDLGVRWGAIDADVATPAMRQRRENGRTWLRRAAAALNSGNRDLARRLLDRGAWLAPADPRVDELRQALR